MKKLILLACVSVLAFAQQAISPDGLDVTSDSIDWNGSIRHLAGHVVIKTNAVTIRTTTAEYNMDTNAITTHGETTMELK